MRQRSGWVATDDNQGNIVVWWARADEESHDLAADDLRMVEGDSRAQAPDADIHGLGAALDETVSVEHEQGSNRERDDRGGWRQIMPNA
jgi:hypothetical protein